VVVKPSLLRRGRVMIRHTSTPVECDNDIRRTRALRTIPESDSDFARLYGIREDTESMHHHLKTLLWNGRARCVGIRRNQINLHGYQLRVAVTALLHWQRRTHGDLDDWFGRWHPPDTSSRAA
jgi:hypothetical protein